MENIKNLKIPTTQKQIKRFLGPGYYRKFVKNCATIAKPLTACLKKNVRVEHTTKSVEAFETIKQILCNEPVLAYTDFSKPFILTTNVSNVGISAILSQSSIGSDRPIAYISTTLNEHEMNYSTIEKECLNIIFVTKQFRSYLYGNIFRNNQTMHASS